jgi:fucose 4-O-acetylase-like acetyltransferase
MENRRIEFIDIMKGIGIILVVVGHISQLNILNTWIFSFHMPLFFFISGITFSVSKKENFIRKKVNKILIPYFIFSLLTFIYWSVIERKLRGDTTSILSQFIGIFTSQGGEYNHVYNIVMWFLPCLFITEIIFYFIKNKFSNKMACCLLAVSSILGVILSYNLKIRLPWSIDTMLIAIVFYGAGYLISNVVMNYKKSDKNKLMNFLSIFILLALNIYCSHLNGYVDMNKSIYSNYFLYFISAFCGIIFIYLISLYCNLQFVRFLGANSLIIMCVHEPIKRMLLKIISVISKIDIDVIRINLIGIIISLLILLVCILPIIYIVNKYLPFIIGNKYIKNNDNYIKEQM